MKILQSALLVLLSSVSFSYAADLNVNDPVRLTVVDEIRSGRTKSGTKVNFVVTENVTNHRGEVLIRKGTAAQGLVTNSRHAGAWGRRGVVEVTLSNTTSADGQIVPLRATTDKKGAPIKKWVHMGAWLVAWPVAMIRGENVVIKPGTEVTAFVDQPLQVATHRKQSPRAPRQNFAQKILLKDGTKFDGTVLGLQNDTYTLATEAGTFDVPAHVIQSIANSES